MEYKGNIEGRMRGGPRAGGGRVGGGGSARAPPPHPPLYTPYIFHIYFLNMFHIFSLVCFLIYSVNSRFGHDHVTTFDPNSQT